MTDKSARKEVHTWQNGRMTSRSTWIFTPIALLSVATFVAILVMMGLRIDREDLSPAPPSRAENERQSLAVSATRIANTARSLSDKSQEFAHTAELADTWAEELGGVWQAWPDPAPSGYTNAPVSTAAPQGAGTSELLAMLDEFDHQALTSGYPQHALSARLSSIQIATVSGLEKTCGTVNMAVAAQSASSEEALNASEVTRQWLEHEAALVPAGKREAELARIETIRSFQSMLLTNGAKDRRPAVVSLPSLPEKTTLTDAALRTLTSQLMANAQGKTYDDAEALVSFSCSLYLTDDERAHRK